MLNTKYRLQLLSHNEIFETRADAIEYINDNFKGQALWSEPAVFFYGTEREPKMIIAVGATVNNSRPRLCIIDEWEVREMINSLSETIDTTSQNVAQLLANCMDIISATGLTYDDNKINNKISYEPDPSDALISNAKSLAEAIAIISTFVQNKVKEISLTVTDSPSINLTETTANNGTVLQADVNISTQGDEDDLWFNNNIVGVRTDGLYAAANLEYDNVRDQLIFTTSGIDGTGKFKTDCNKKIINLGKHSSIISQNNGNTSTITITNNESTNTYEISANVNVYNSTDNLIEIKNNALYANLRGSSTDTTNVSVEKLNAGGWEVKSDVRLSSDNSITIADGGLKVNLQIDLDEATNTLTFTLGDVVKAVTLPGINVIDKIDYDAQNKQIIITANGQEIIIPVNDIVETWSIDNHVDSPIVLHRDASTTGVEDKVYATLKLRSNDNLLSVDPSTGNLYVPSSTFDNRFNAIETSVSNVEYDLRQETTRSTLKDEEHEQQLSSISTALNALHSTVDTISPKVSANETAISHEEARATRAEDALRETLTNVRSDLTGLTETVRIVSGKAESNTQAIQSETQRAEGREDDLFTQIGQISTSVDQRLISAQRAIEAETTRAQASEQLLATNISEINTRMPQLIAASEERSQNSIAAIGQTANNYTDAKIAAEKERAERIETALSERTSVLETGMEQVQNSLTDKINTVVIEKNSESDLQYFLKVDGVTVSEINIPKDNFVSSVRYDEGNKSLVFVFETSSGSQTVSINISDLVDTYTAGNGLTLTNNQFSVVLNEDTESYLQLTPEGLKVVGIDAKIDGLQGSINDLDNTKSDKSDTYTKNQVDDIIVSLKQSDIAPINESISTLTEVTQQHTRTLDHLNGNVAEEGSIKNQIDTVKQYLEGYVNEQVHNEATERVNMDLELSQKKANAEDVYLKSVTYTQSEVNAKFAEERVAVGNTYLSKDTFENFTDGLNDTISDIQGVLQTETLSSLYPQNSDTVNLTYSKSASGDVTETHLKADVKLNSTNVNNILRADSNGLLATVELSYNNATNTLTFTTSNNQPKVIQLSNASLVSNAYYSDQLRAIVLTIKDAHDREYDITIPLADLITSLSIDTVHAEEDPVKLIKTTSEEGIQELSATLAISSSQNNALQVVDGHLFVSNQASSIIVDYPTLEEGENNVQKALEDLYQTSNDLRSDINAKYTELSSSIHDNQSDISDIKQRLDNIHDELPELDQITNLADNVTALNNRMDGVESNYDMLHQRLSTVEGKVLDITQRTSSLETDMMVLKSYIGQYDTTLGTIAERLAHIEFVVNNLIDFSDTNGDGTPDGF